MSFKKAVLSITFVAFLFASPGQLLAVESGDRVVAKVGSISINAFEVNTELQKLIPMQLSFHGNLKKEKIDKLREEALQTLIERAYKFQYAISEEIAVDPEALEKKWQSFRTKYAQSLDKMAQKYVSAYRANIYQELLAEKAENVAVNQRVQVSDDEVASYYESNKHRYFRPKSFTASHIFVKLDPADNKDEKSAKLERADALLQRARAGEDFYNLAYYESDDRSKYVGGSLGTFHANQVVPEFAEAIEKMKPGEISDVVKTLYGYHIIKVDNIDEARQLEFEEVSTKIRSLLEEQERQELYDSWMSDLKERYPLERFENQ